MMTAAIPQETELVWLAALCDTGSPERDGPRIVTLSFSVPPPELE